MNELLFLIHLLLISFFVFGSLRLGKETLTSLIVLQAIIANLFVLKQTILFGWTVTCSDVFAVGSLLSLNLLQERFGKEAAQKATMACFFLMVFFSFMGTLHLFYVPSPEDRFQTIYASLLTPTPRLFFASLLSFVLVQQADIALFSFLKKKMTTASWTMRSLISMSCSQGLDTLLFSILGLWGLVSNLREIMIASFVVKMSAVVAIQNLLPLLMKRKPHEI